MTTTTHIASAEIKSISTTGTFSGYAALFNQPDLSGEIIQRGAFLTTLSERTQKLPLLLNHKDAVGSFTVIREDTNGLYVEGQINLDTQSGRDAYSLMKQGALTGLSIAFMPDDFIRNRDGSRTITKLNLLEISLTPVPAQPKAQVTSVRSLDVDATEDEDQDWGSIIAALQEFSA